MSNSQRTIDSFPLIQISDTKYEHSVVFIVEKPNYNVFVAAGALAARHSTISIHFENGDMEVSLETTPKAKIDNAFLDFMRLYNEIITLELTRLKSENK